MGGVKERPASSDKLKAKDADFCDGKLSHREKELLTAANVTTMDHTTCGQLLQLPKVEEEVEVD